MKKFLLIAVMMMTSVVLFAQNDVTKFLGIPVDGFKSEMIRKLKAKGFVSSSYDPEILEGEFNGTDVNVHIVTNNNKVYRILLSDKTPIDETNIKIRFNNLCRQFSNNDNYIVIDDYTIPEYEDISYETLVNDKRYEAVFYQLPDTTMLMENLQVMALEKYTEEELANPTKEIEEDLNEMSYSYLMDIAPMKPVWFMIDDIYGGYSILMYYDNEYNRANGEDL
ncbi:MAG TPA: hypothetical protein IAA77_01555 [Candidatus Avibacteroides excrementipullorum]|nr:hypothetical protein [Candidatus Avibacteroides excrementipullorum]